jgi:hypothetical protein
MIEPQEGRDSLDGHGYSPFFHDIGDHYPIIEWEGCQSTGIPKKMPIQLAPAEFQDLAVSSRTFSPSWEDHIAMQLSALDPDREAPRGWVKSGACGEWATRAFPAGSREVLSEPRTQRSGVIGISLRARLGQPSNGLALVTAATAALPCRRMGLLPNGWREKLTQRFPAGLNVNGGGRVLSKVRAEQGAAAVRGNLYPLQPSR